MRKEIHSALYKTRKDKLRKRVKDYTVKSRVFTHKQYTVEYGNVNWVIEVRVREVQDCTVDGIISFWWGTCLKVRSFQYPQKYNNTWPRRPTFSEVSHILKTKSKPWKFNAIYSNYTNHVKAKSPVVILPFGRHNITFQRVLTESIPKQKQSDLFLSYCWDETPAQCAAWKSSVSG